MLPLAARSVAKARERSSDVVFVGGACLLSIAVGWKIGNNSPREPLAIALSMVVLVIAARAFGVAAGLLVLGALNGLPFVDLEEYSQSRTFRISDLAIMVLVGLLALRNQAAVANPRLQRWLVATRWWSVALIVWWLITVLRSNFFSDIPLTKAALFGRDFLYFALLLPLLVGGLRNRREVWQLLGTLVAAVILFAVGHVALVVTNISEAAWFVHESLSNDVGGVTRVYALMGDAVVAAVSAGIALALIGHSRRARAYGLALALPCAASVLLQFARATYFGLFLGLLCASAIWLGGSARGGAARRLAFVVAALALVGAVVLAGTARTTSSTAYAVTPELPQTAAIPAPAIVASRFSSGVIDISTRSGTVGYRYELDRKMFHVLGDHWLIGVGFWHPDVKYVAALPDGSIRNTDTGGMNSLMTMGVVGTVLMYLPPLVVLLAIFRKKRAVPGREQWFFFGMFTWIAALVAGSVSLVTLFSVSGVALSAVLLATTIRLLAEHERGHG